MIRMMLVLSVFISFSAFGGIYRWVDEQGEVHFSDKKPEKQSAAEVSGDLKPINRDSGAGETEKLRQIFKGETPEEQNYRLGKQNKQQSKMQQACKQARSSLKKLHGRFYMTGKDGKEIVISEDEQKQMIKKLEGQIKKHC